MDSIVQSFAASPQPAMEPSGESVFHNDGGALVTNLKCVFAGEARVYATSGITSVGMYATHRRSLAQLFRQELVLDTILKNSAMGGRSLANKTLQSSFRCRQISK
jgi:hypothetical protein